MSFELRAPAKINLWLEVLGKRSDGYHELSTLMLPVRVFDELCLSLQTGGITLECSHWEIPGDHTNLAWRAAELYLQESRWETGVHIELRKIIPAGAGLGGGSSDAGAVLLGLNRLCPTPFPREELTAMAAELGADVPFFVLRRPALATGIGERLEPVAGLPVYPLVLIKPPLNVSTGWVYGRLKLTRQKSHFSINALLAHPWRLEAVMHNDLESVTVEAYPLVKEIKGWLESQGALGAVMSGSGSAVVGVFRDASQAERVGALAEREWERCWVVVAETLESAPLDPGSI